MRVKMSKPPPAPTASAVGPCPTVIQIVGRPGTGSLPSTIAPPDHPPYHNEFHLKALCAFCTDILKIELQTRICKTFYHFTFFLHTKVGIVGHYQKKVGKSRSTEKSREK